MEMKKSESGVIKKQNKIPGVKSDGTPPVIYYEQRNRKHIPEAD